MKHIFFWGAILFLLVLHQDYWQWGASHLVFGFVPYPLAYHMGVSIAAAIVWSILVMLCWPSDNDDLQIEDSREETK